MECVESEFNSEVSQADNDVLFHDIPFIYIVNLFPNFQAFKRV